MSSLVTSRTRWFVAAAAVGSHGSIGAVYAYSVYTKPLMSALGWRYEQVTLAFSLAIACLGLSAAFLGKIIEQRGPRQSGMFAALCYGGGLMLAGLAVSLKSPVLFYLGYGVIGGIGLGVGYLTPVATLVKWFPDRRGLATGLAIMGFGFGALLAGPLVVKLIAVTGLARTFMLMGGGYMAVMLLCAQGLRRPPEGWAPQGWTGTGATTTSSPTVTSMTPRQALFSPRFALLWLLFFIQVTCGIAIISAASPMAQEIAGLTAAQAATMVGVMGLFNGFGRLGWSAFSDVIGRPATFMAFCVVQGAAFFVLPQVAHPLLFQGMIFLIISCYGGGFATLPAYVGDLYGGKNLAVIYGYMLTAWSAAGIAGPMLAAKVRAHTGGFEGMLRYGAAGFAVALVLAVFIRAQRVATTAR
ncbi:MAG: OFA family MFS transporter [Opitutaceae bacterium]|nr:OFA family MFS transporter [Opitutaceae bacterium]